MYYEYVLSEHRQRVARGVENYERCRVAAERVAESVAAQEQIEPVQESDETTTGNDEGTPGNDEGTPGNDEGTPGNGDSSESGIGSGFVSANR
ncbi:hypothetical protein J2W54_005021 [Rhodococcus fascians]|nr:hypothetical protein [Rhodococcus sp. 3258]MDR6934605.1 hypothetical protein [Rhodococcus fascians]